MEDRVTFEQAFQFHGKNFQRIRTMVLCVQCIIVLLSKCPIYACILRLVSGVLLIHVYIHVHEQSCA